MPENILITPNGLTVTLAANDCHADYLEVVFGGDRATVIDRALAEGWILAGIKAVPPYLSFEDGTQTSAAYSDFIPHLPPQTAYSAWERWVVRLAPGIALHPEPYSAWINNE